MSTKQMIPVHTPLFEGNEKKYLQECIDTGWVSSKGQFVKRFEQAFAEKTQTKLAIAVANGTAALETALWSAGIRNGEVIMPASTIISCAIAVLRVGAKPVFVDMEGSPTMDTKLIKEKITENTRAIMAVHLFGYSENMDKILRLADKYGLKVIEDFSQSWGLELKGDAGCYSLYSNKLVNCGEGGIIVTNCEHIAHQAREYIDLYHSKERFIHSQIGYNFRISNLQAAVALAQLEQVEKFIEIKLRNYGLYQKYLNSADTILHKVELPWMYLIKADSAEGTVTYLKDKGIDSRRFFYPLPYQPALMFLHQHKKMFHQADALWQKNLYLPSGLTLTEEEIKYICGVLNG